MPHKFKQLVLNVRSVCSHKKGFVWKIEKKRIEFSPGAVACYWHWSDGRAADPAESCRSLLCVVTRILEGDSRVLKLVAAMSRLL